MRLRDLSKQRFGRLVVIARAPSRGKRTYWRCRCDCGNECTVEAYNLTHGHTKSCGCYAGSKSYENLSESRLYGIWEGMISRCENRNKENYQYYGARGISVCPEWHDFKVFQTWAVENGYKDFLTIDRINTNGNYCPENCRWASWETQNNNRRNNRILRIAGVRMTLTQAAGIYGISRATVYRRLKCGWPIERALGVRPSVNVSTEDIANATNY